MTDDDLGRELRAAGLISDLQLQTALEYQHSLGGRLTDIIVKLGFTEEAKLNRIVARCEHVPSVDVGGRPPDADLMAQIPRRIIEEHLVLPYRQSDARAGRDTILLAMTEATDFAVIEEIQFLTNCKVESALAPRSQIREQIVRFYAEHPQHAAPEQQVEADEKHMQEVLLGKVADPTVAALARLLIAKGVIDAESWQRELEKLDERTDY